jgi:ComF family protein
MEHPNLLLPTCRDLPHTPVRRIINGLLNLLYPDVCLICSSPIARAAERSVCSDCWQKVLQQRITEPFCPCCGHPYGRYEVEATHLCGTCCIELPPYAAARAFGHYGSGLAQIIQALKFDGRKNLAGLLAPLMASVYLQTWPPREIELIVPVPLHPRREHERGYNQSALLGRKLARLVGVSISDHALARTRPTAPQVGLSHAARLENVHRAFRCLAAKAVLGRRILLVDDVLTTGSTAASSCKALLEAGAARVSVLTAARATAGWE